ncbi:MAG: acyltransferase [Clostridium sp.]|nr:acyltransferase [Clostridium sp.]
MTEQSENKLKITLEGFIDIYKSENKNLIIFGASKMGSNTIKILKNKNIKVDLICDNDINKQGKFIEGIKICSIKNLKIVKSEIIILITSMYYRAINAQLKNLGYENVYYIPDIFNKITRKNYLPELLSKYGNFISIDRSTVIGPNFKFTEEYLSEGLHLKVGKQNFLCCNVIYLNDSGLIKIGERNYIGPNSKLMCVNNINIGNDVMISYDCTIYDNDSHSIYWKYRKDDVLTSLNDFKYGTNNKNWENVISNPIKIEDKVWIGFGVTILKGVTIGEGSVIGAQSVVTHDVEPYTVVAGNPAKVVKVIKNK